MGRITSARLRWREGVKIGKEIERLAWIESGRRVREREADVDKHCHLLKEAELPANGHMIYGPLKFALPHSSQSSHVPPIFHTQRLANGSGTLWDARTQLCGGSLTSSSASVGMFKHNSLEFDVISWELWYHIQWDESEQSSLAASELLLARRTSRDPRRVVHKTEVDKL